MSQSNEPLIKNRAIFMRRVVQSWPHPSLEILPPMPSTTNAGQIWTNRLLETRRNHGFL